MDVPQAVMASMAATFFQLGLARLNVQFIVRDQNFIGLNFEKFGQSPNRFT